MKKHKILSAVVMVLFMVFSLGLSRIFADDVDTSSIPSSSQVGLNVSTSADEDTNVTESSEINNTEPVETNTTPATDVKKFDISTNETTQVNQSQDSEALPNVSEVETLPMPAALVGTWVGKEVNVEIRATFNEDGTGTSTQTIYNTTSTYPITIKKVIKVADNLYRVVEGDVSQVTEGGIGGSLVKYDLGFYFDGQTFQAVAWEAEISKDFDYTKPLFYATKLTRFVETKTSQESDPASVKTTSEKPCAPSVVAVQKNNKGATQNQKSTLPRTGEEKEMISKLGVLVFAFGLLPFVKIRNREL